MLFSCREEGQDTEGMEKTVQSGYAQVAIKSVLDRKRETDRKTDRKKEKRKQERKRKKERKKDREKERGKERKKERKKEKENPTLIKMRNIQA